MRVSISLIALIIVILMLATPSEAKGGLLTNLLGDLIGEASGEELETSEIGLLSPLLNTVGQAVQTVSDVVDDTTSIVEDTTNIVNDTTKLVDDTLERTLEVATDLTNDVSVDKPLELVEDVVGIVEETTNASIEILKSTTTTVVETLDEISNGVENTIRHVNDVTNQIPIVPPIAIGVDTETIIPLPLPTIHLQVGNQHKSYIQPNLLEKPKPEKPETPEIPETEKPVEVPETPKIPDVETPESPETSVDPVTPEKSVVSPEEEEVSPEQQEVAPVDSAIPVNPDRIKRNKSEKNDHSNKPIESSMQVDMETMESHDFPSTEMEKGEEINSSDEELTTDLANDETVDVQLEDADNRTLPTKKQPLPVNKSQKSIAVLLVSAQGNVGASGSTASQGSNSSGISYQGESLYNGMITSQLLTACGLTELMQRMNYFLSDQWSNAPPGKPPTISFLNCKLV